MISPNEHIFTITELNQSVRLLLERNFQKIWIEGEISNFVQPASGHFYFSLKDQKAQVRCAMFRLHNSRLKFQPKDGMHVLVRAKVSLYEGRGDFQLIVEQLEEMGAGALQRAFEQLKEKLLKEGLFAEEHKKPLPKFPQCLGVITSPTGAAIRDILHVLKRRFPCLPVIIYPTLVQGEEAAPQIVKAINVANERNECNLLLLARGGGSLEDLWPFNEEIVARAVFASKLPIISGIGHEVDFTIADFVADRRAPTPSSAAELATPDQAELLSIINFLNKKLSADFYKLIQFKKDRLNWLLKRLKQQHPMQQLQQQSQLLDRLSSDLRQAIQHTIDHKKTVLKGLAKALDIASPLATLSRGYAVVTNEKGKAITDSKQVHTDELLNVRLAKGRLRVRPD